MINRHIILASSSPRRQYIMKEAGFDFTVKSPDITEDFPDNLPIEDVAKYVAIKKANSFKTEVGDNLVIAADTVVILNNKILFKPNDKIEAIDMLTSLSGNKHKVMTGVSILSKERQESFDDTTEVTFVKLSAEQIEFYVENYKPYDKAGAYGAQDWIGMIAIEKIVGSYFNVMGLPIHLVYAKLSNWK